MSLKHCQLCGNAWANHGTACPPLKVVYDPSHEADATTAYMVGVEAGKDAMRAEVTKLREELEEARKAIEPFGALAHDLKFLDMGTYYEVRETLTVDTLIDSLESARAFLACKEAK